MRIHILLAAVFAVGAAPTAVVSATAQASTAPKPLPSGAAADIVRDVTAVLRKEYVFPERADAIVQRLQASLASGRYSTDNPAVLSERMSADLEASSGGDKHMYINYKPAEAAALGKPGKAPDPAFFRQQMALSNHGITELKVLPGNVRYMNISQWHWDPDGVTKAIYDDAMRFLRGGNAIIIDLRGNGGGAAQPVQYVAAHFMDPGQKLITFRAGPDQVEEIVSPKIAAGKITAKPLMVLVGPGSASASEEFAAHVKNFKLGTLIGQTTAGAGNPNGEFPVAHGFVVSVSTGTAVHPVTNKGWEGEGISPDRQVELSKALDAAHLEALRAQLATASPQRRPALEWMIAGLAADGPQPTAAELRTFAGAYSGNRTITERGGRLYWRVGDGPDQEMIALGGGLFAIGQRVGTRARFEPTGASVQLLRLGAPPERLERTRA